jgi:4-amino-4-deoxy-L-arabinose transferase-like glycosyltransferase
VAPAPEVGADVRRQVEKMKAGGRLLLSVSVAIFVFLLFLELPGSFLFEPDEARYAEIPREMLATGNWLVPKLNFVDYFEKPPLLYWANAASLKFFGLNPFAARLPGRLATLGTVLVLALGLRRILGGRASLLAGLVCLSSPLFFWVGRTNITDGLLTFNTTVAAVALHRYLLEREAGGRARGWAALAGLGCGLAVMTKGAVGVVLPGGALLLWCALARRWVRLKEILLSPAPVVCLAVTLPYFVAVERAAPGFSNFFWFHEHLLRYATSEASRPGPLFYFPALFAAGFLPWTFFLGGVGRRLRPGAASAFEDRATDLWYLLYAAFVLVFFSLSQSKLPPYILPMFPAAAVLVARDLADDRVSVTRPLFVGALFWTCAAPAGLLVGLRQGDLAHYGVAALAATGLAALAVTAWVAAAVSRRSREAAVFIPLGGWIFFTAGLIFTFPRVAVDRSAHLLAVAARDAAAGGAEVVAYRTYLQGFPWVLERRLPIYGWRGELAFGSERGDQSEWFRPEQAFLKDWDSEKKMVVLLRELDRPLLFGHRANFVAQNRKYLVVTNF